MSNDESLQSLRNSVFKFNKGIPDHLRGKIYKLLLGIKFNSKNHRRNIDNFGLLTFLNNPIFDYASQDVIEHDVNRTRSTFDFFNLPDNKFLLKALLTFYSKNVCPYKQGMNEVLAPLLYLIDDSFGICDVYNAFTEIIERYLSNLYTGEYFHKLKLTFRIFNRILWYQDPVLAFMLEQNGITPDLYSTWWFLTLFASKHELPIIYCIWDYYIAEDNKSLLLFIGVAFVMYNRKHLLSCDPSQLPEEMSKLKIKDIKQFHQIWNLAKSLYNNTPSTVIDFVMSNFGAIKNPPNENSINYSSGIFTVDRDDFTNKNCTVYTIDIRSKEIFDRESNKNSVHFDTSKDWSKTIITTLRNIFANNDSFRSIDYMNDISPTSIYKPISYQKITNPSLFPCNFHINTEEKTLNFMNGRISSSEGLIFEEYSEQDRRAIEEFSVSNCHLMILGDQTLPCVDVFLGNSIPKSTLTSFYTYLVQNCLLPRVSIIGKKSSSLGSKNIITHNVNVDRYISKASIGDSFNKFKSALGRLTSINVNNNISSSLTPLDIISWCSISTLDNFHHIGCHIELVYQPVKIPIMRWLSCYSNYRKLLNMGIMDYNFNWEYSKGDQMYRLILSKHLILIVSVPEYMDIEISNSSNVDYFISGKRTCLEDPLVYNIDPTISNWSELISTQAKIAAKNNRKNIIKDVAHKSDSGYTTPDKLHNINAVYVYGVFHTNTISKITSAKNNYTIVSFYFSSNTNEPLFRCKFFAKEDTKMCLDIIKMLYQSSRNIVTNDN